MLILGPAPARTHTPTQNKLYLQLAPEPAFVTSNTVHYAGDVLEMQSEFFLSVKNKIKKLKLMYTLALQKQNVNESSTTRNLVPLEYQFSYQNSTKPLLYVVRP